MSGVKTRRAGAIETSTMKSWAQANENSGGGREQNGGGTLPGVTGRLGVPRGFTHRTTGVQRNTGGGGNSQGQMETKMGRQGKRGTERWGKRWLRGAG